MHAYEREAWGWDHHVKSNFGSWAHIVLHTLNTFSILMPFLFAYSKHCSLTPKHFSFTPNHFSVLRNHSFMDRESQHYCLSITVISGTLQAFSLDGNVSSYNNAYVRISNRHRLHQRHHPLLIRQTPCWTGYINLT